MTLSVAVFPIPAESRKRKAAVSRWSMTHVTGPVSRPLSSTQDPASLSTSAKKQRVAHEKASVRQMLSWYHSDMTLRPLSSDG